jgi:hypothetical protein
MLVKQAVSASSSCGWRTPKDHSRTSDVLDVLEGARAESKTAQAN